MTRPTTPLAICAAALRADLAASYPDTRFSVACRPRKARPIITVRWEDGPTEYEVRRLADRLTEGHGASIPFIDTIRWCSGSVRCRRCGSPLFAEEVRCPDCAAPALRLVA
ncbi:MAG: hypothetical protein QM753_12050 [Thermomicrobiales bacterium]